ncbi:MAG: DUF1848 domain-containing protein [Planctomycetes bacterium]|nr:DUF1848 domain-containing protein [Planctomycetota bacterium]
MKRIISVSRRTDIPAFYGDWFMQRIREGFAGVVNPFGGRRYRVSLKPEDVACFVFWSKDLTPFADHLEALDRLGYRFYFNYTVTALPSVFESGVDREAALNTLKTLSGRYSPAHINWRFDPIILSSISDEEFYLRAFESFAVELEGLVERCIFSFVDFYGKVRRNFKDLAKAHGVRVDEPTEQAQIDLANQLAEIAARHGITMYACCEDGLVGERIQKAHCVDGALVERLFGPSSVAFRDKGTRPECGCTESTDIGTYNTCPHGCVYCYANSNKVAARAAFDQHDPDSAFLGYSKAQSDAWIAEWQETSS